RMNYYAVTALLARISLYRGNYTMAARYALEVINSGKFRFIRSNEIEQTDGYGVIQKQDRLFEPEMIFALNTDNILSVSRSYYEGLTQDFVKSTHAYADGDVRTVWFFANPSAGGKINMVRYERSTQVTDSKKYGDPVVPMLKLSEMYLIAAECGLHNTSTGIDARAMLNELKRARGAAEIGVSASPSDLRREITHEYICDFKGEGQLFYYYKRMNMAAVDDGNYNGNTIAVPAEAYTLPLPEYEKQFGYGQNR
ncbi:MAG: RagB/SusD family nutrient uptake outer membrane protein, partial [Prevotellaceae bacterium]|nr:RagB/SusD family nutrient uptake outer membrane protein [Prevotellaceae bacterium]